MYYVVRKGFLGGGIVSRHQSLAHAEQAALRYRGWDYPRESAAVVDNQHYDELPYASQDSADKPSRR